MFRSSLGGSNIDIDEHRSLTCCTMPILVSLPESVLGFLPQVLDELHVCVFGLGCWSCRRVPLQGACVRVLFALLSLVAGAAAGLLLLGCCCQSAVSALKLGWWLPLQGATVRALLSELFALWSLAAKVLHGAGAARSAAAGYCCRVL